MCPVDYQGRFVTFLELLRLYANAFVIITSHLSLLREPRLNRGTVSPEELSRIRKVLAQFKEMTTRANLNICVRHIDDLLLGIDHLGILPSQHQITALEQALERELSTRVFLSMLPQRERFFERPLESWEKVIDSFPDAQEDIEEMNKCYALSRYTASVFHSLLVVEHGLIALGRHIGVSDPKPGWDATYRKLNELINIRSAIPPHLDFNFLEQSKARLDSMKLAWRNKVNHAAGRLMIEKAGFSDLSSEEVIIACRSFMRHLAEGLPK